MEKKKVKKTSKKKATKVNEKSFIKEIKEEMKKVKWPSKEDMRKYTIATIVFILIFGLYFFGLDSIFAWIKGIVG